MATYGFLWQCPEVVQDIIRGKRCLCVCVCACAHARSVMGTPPWWPHPIPVIFYKPYLSPTSHYHSQMKFHLFFPPPLWFSFVFRDRVSLYSPGCLGTHFVDQAGLELRNPPASASRVLGLKACVTTPSEVPSLNSEQWELNFIIWSFERNPNSV
jgi:hypothetical protein